MDRMSPQDASFLHIEDGVNHMNLYRESTSSAVVEEFVSLPSGR